MSEQTDIYFPAICTRELYRNEANNYAIFGAEINAQSKYFDASKYPAEWVKTANAIVTTKSFNEFKEIINKPMVFSGKIVVHKKYGKQFEAWGCFVDNPTDIRGMENYLATLPHIGVERAKLLMKHIPVNEMGDVIENDIGRIVVLKIGLTEDRMNLVREKWLKDVAMREVHMWIARHNISPLIGEKIISEWKEKTIEIIEADPYKLTSISGIGFKTADDIAYRVLDPVPAEKRVEAALGHVLNEATQEEGHLCLTYDLIKKRTLELLIGKDPGNDYKKLIESAIVSKDPLRFSAVRTIDKNLFIYRSETWRKVRGIAESLSLLAKSQSSFACSDSDITLAENELQRYYGKPEFRLNDLQKEAIKSAFEKKLTVLTGGGGTGKSTICRAIVKISELRDIQSGRLSVSLMAPTGKAAKVLTRKTSLKASTIHKALGLMPGATETSVSINSNILIVDEFSMCGLDTVYAIFAALKGNPGCNVVFVGDPQQLPSVSPGNFLADIIESKVANVVKLNTIYRQSEKSFITTVADLVAKGRAIGIPREAEDIEIKEIVNGDDIVRLACEAMRKHLEDGGSVDEIQMLSPQYAGPAGVDRINAALQQMIAERNNVVEKMFAGSSLFYVGDKVMQLKNDYEKDVYNGDIGIVKAAGQKMFESENLEPFISVDFEDRGIVVYRTGDFSEIKPAWCITVHKFQGSQCRKIVFVMYKGHSYMLNRELVYTGITRAEKHVLILGNEDVIPRASRISVIKKRNTTLVDEIQELLGTGKSLFYYNCIGIEDNLPLRRPMVAVVT